MTRHRRQRVKDFGEALPRLRQVNAYLARIGAYGRIHIAEDRTMSYQPLFPGSMDVLTAWGDTELSGVTLGRLGTYLMTGRWVSEADDMPQELREEAP